MPAFETPEPIAVIVDLHIGDTTIIASDRADTTVEVRPADPAKKDDVRAARETTVEFAAGQLTVRAPRWWRSVSALFGADPAISLTIEVPAGSRLHGTASVGRFLVTGELGPCTLRASVGDLQLEKAGPLELQTSGNITVDQAVDRAAITTSTGIVRVRAIDGSAVVKNSNGDSTIGDVSGDLAVQAANGNITVGRPGSSVTAKTANGNIRIGDAARGTVHLETARGELEVGIHPGSAAYLDVSAKFGALRNLMDRAGPPAQGEETVRVYARTSFGNIIIRPAAPGSAAALDTGVRPAGRE